MSEEPAPPRAEPPDLRKIFQELDWDKVPLPSDRLTLGQLRQAIGGDHEELGVFVHNLTLTEQELARLALSEALKAPFDEEAAHVPRVLKEERAKELAKLYKEAGLAAGPHGTAELIRELEDWASCEARKHVPSIPR